MSSDQIKRIRESMQQKDGKPISADDLARDKTMLEFDLGFAVPEEDVMVEKITDEFLFGNAAANEIRNHLDGSIRRPLARAETIMREFRSLFQVILRECLQANGAIAAECRKKLEDQLFTELAKALDLAPSLIARAWDEFVAAGGLFNPATSTICTVESDGSLQCTVDPTGTPFSDPRIFPGVDVPGVPGTPGQPPTLPSPTPGPTPFPPKQGPPGGPETPETPGGPVPFPRGPIPRGPTPAPFPRTPGPGPTVPPTPSPTITFCDTGFVHGDQVNVSNCPGMAPLPNNICVANFSSEICPDGSCRVQYRWHQADTVPGQGHSFFEIADAPCEVPPDFPSPPPLPPEQPDDPELPGDPELPEVPEEEPTDGMCPEMCFYLDCNAKQILCLEEGACPPTGAISLGKGCPSLETLTEWMDQCGLLEEKDCKLCVDCKTGEVIIRMEEPEGPMPVPEGVSTGPIDPPTDDDTERDGDLVCLRNDRASVEQIQRIIREQCEREEPGEPPERPEPGPEVEPECDLPGSVKFFGNEELGKDICELLGIPKGERGFFEKNICGIIDTLLNGLNGLDFVTDCLDPRQPSIRIAKVLFGAFNQWVSQAFPDVEQALDNWLNFICPTGIPTIDAAMSMYLTDSVSEEQARCWIRANGLDDKWFDAMENDARSKLGIGELVALRRREKLAPRVYDLRMRQLGFIRQDERDSMFDLSEQIPPATDISRMMVRDVEDDDIVDKFKLDTDFDKKFKGQLKEWAEHQGVSETWMNRLWRAHWDIPAPGQLSEMWQRLRDVGNVPLGQFLNEQGVDTAGLDPEIAAESVGVSIDDITEALQQQDILPFWISKFVALTFERLGRRDTIRLLRQGVIDENRTVELFKAAGFSPRDSADLTEAVQRERQQSALRNPVVAEFARGELSESELRRKLADSFIVGSNADKVARRAKLELVENRRKKCVASIRKRTLDGELSETESITLITEQGLDFDQAKVISDGFQCEKKAQGKHASVTQLCEWFRLGVLDQADFFTRLTNVGWSVDDAVRIVRQCEIRMEKEMSIEETKRIKECIRKKKLAQAESKRTFNQIQKQLRQRKRSLQTARLSQKQRTKALGKINSTMAAKLEISEPDAKPATNQVFDILKNRGVWNQDEVLALMLEAVDDPFVETHGDLLSATFQLLNQRIFPSPQLDDIPFPPKEPHTPPLETEVGCDETVKGNGKP